MKLILASKSPRRIQLMQDAGYDFEVVHSDYSEPFDEKLTPEELVILHAENKAMDIAKKYRNRTVIGVDTVGFYDGKILEKPHDRTHAKEMINYLNNSTHEVYSGVVVVNLEMNKKIVQYEKTHVSFGKMSEEDIEWYLDQNEWQDKSAAYAIQGKGALFVKSIEGDFFNVVGLPLYKLNQILKEFF